MGRIFSLFVVVVAIFGMAVGIDASPGGNVTIAQDSDLQQSDSQAAGPSVLPPTTIRRVPEPSTLVLLGSGMAGLIGFGILTKKLKR